MRCFVTVGTTHFDELINNVLSDGVLSLLADFGIRELSVQYGQHFDFHSAITSLPNVKQIGSAQNLVYLYQDIKIRGKLYFPSLVQEMKEADLIIGHAGAGTSMESLSLQKPLIIVVNDKLMDNHQTELAQKLAEDGYAHMAQSPSELENTLRVCKIFERKEFPKPTSWLTFANYIDHVMNPSVEIGS